MRIYHERERERERVHVPTKCCEYVCEREIERERGGGGNFHNRNTWLFTISMSMWSIIAKCLKFSNKVAIENYEKNQIWIQNVE